VARYKTLGSTGNSTFLCTFNNYIQGLLSQHSAILIYSTLPLCCSCLGISIFHCSILSNGSIWQQTATILCTFYREVNREVKSQICKRNIQCIYWIQVYINGNNKATPVTNKWLTFHRHSQTWMAGWSTFSCQSRVQGS